MAGPNIESVKIEPSVTSFSLIPKIDADSADSAIPDVR